MARRTRPLLLALAGLLAILLLTVLSNVLGGRFGAGPRPDTSAPRGSAPTGRVRTASGAPPPPGTRVIALGAGERVETVADENGEFRFDPVPPGLTGYEAQAGPLRARARAAGGGPVEITLPGRFTACGRVVDEGTGAPIPGAEVTCGGCGTRTGPRGRFRLEGVPAPGGKPPPLVVGAPGRGPQRFAPGPDAAWDDLYLRIR